MSLDDIDRETRSTLAGELSVPFIINFTQDSESVTIEGDGFFDKTYQETDGEGNVVMSENPRLTIAKQEFEEQAFEEVTQDLAENWLVTVTDIEYRVKDSDSYDESTVTLYLKNKTDA